MKINGKYIDPSIFKINTALGDGVTVDFVLVDTPSSVGDLEVLINGISRDITTDYTLVDKTVTFVDAPVLGQQIKFLYIKG